MSSSPKILALLAFYNEQRYLPGYFENLAGRVDGVIALDDGSTDDSRDLVVAQPLTLELLTNAPEAKSGWDEPANRRDLITAGQAAAADWFLTIDADERVEDRFWDEIDTVISWADSHDVISCSFHLRELWGSVDTYRVDGLWGRKTKAALFRNLGPDHQFDEAEWHGEWVPMQSWNTPACRTIPYNLYHLKMIHSADRERRRQRYEHVDPTGEFQAVGYAYLTDEDALELERLPPDRLYRGATSSSA